MRIAVVYRRHSDFYCPVSLPRLLQQYEADKQQLALTDLRVAICRSMRDPIPQECHNLPGSAPNNQVVFGVIAVSAATALLTALLKF